MDFHTDDYRIKALKSFISFFTRLQKTQRYTIDRFWKLRLCNRYISHTYTVKLCLLAQY